MLALAPGHAFAAPGAEVIVSAAASLTNAFRELGPTFEAHHPGATIRFNFGASGTLLQQMQNGAPVDLFASADETTMNEAAAHRLIDPSTRVDFVSNALVVIVPAAAGRDPANLEALEGAAFKRIAIGLPATVPVGRYTQAALERAGLWTRLAPRLIAAQNVRQALDYVARGEVDAGFVYATDAAIMPGKVRVAFRVPTVAPVVYPIAIASGSSHADVARAFIAFVLSADAQRILARYGFAKP